MTPPKLTPNDPRVEHKEILIRNKTYAYIHAKPTIVEKPNGCILLVHGFPDTSFGWRNQVPFFQEQGYEVVAPDMPGYGGTLVPEEDESAWSLKSISDDIAALCAGVFGPKAKIILGGHDWGGALVWRIALWHPELLLGVFSVCTPFFPPSVHYVDFEARIRGGELPTLAYQLQFMSGVVEDHIKTEADIRGLLLALYGGQTPEGEYGMSVQKGLIFDRLGKLGPSPLLTEDEFHEYVRQIAKQGIAGPLKWYRMHRSEYQDELPLAQRKGGVMIDVPSLFITASHDDALPPILGQGMDAYFADLTTKGVAASHWALWEAPEAVNGHVSDWIAAKIEGGAEASL
ncbi:hypothetical protein ACJ41O_010389 [Fusarium nematophilum]